MSSSRPPARNAGRTERLARRFVAFGTRSRAEVAAYLAGKAVPEAEAGRLVEQFIARGEIDDRVCIKLTATHLADNGCATSLIRARLLEKGLDANLIDEILPGVAPAVGDAARARALLAQQRIPPGASSQASRARLFRLLAAHGYDPDLSESLLADVPGPSADAPSHADE